MSNYWAGNHDIRVLFGMQSAGQTKDPCNGHFFIRMGAKAIPFLKEISDNYLSKARHLKNIPSAKKCRELLLPQSSWWQGFPDFASWVMPEHTLEREMKKIAHKSDRFEALCEQQGFKSKKSLRGCPFNGRVYF